MYTKLSIPERLKDLRVVDKHLTLEQLAEQTGLSRSALGKYESDDYKDGELYYQVQQFREIKRSSYRTLVE